MTHDMLDSLINLHYEKVYNIIYLIVQDKFIAEDACQEAFYEAAKSLNNLSNTDKFRSWVLTIATRKAFKMIKKRNKLVLSNNVENYEDNMDRSVEGYILAKELQGEILKLINELDFFYRQVVVLKYYYDMKDSEIAEVLDIPVGTVKSRLYRARNIMRQKAILENKQREVEY